MGLKVIDYVKAFHFQCLTITYIIKLLQVFFLVMGNLCLKLSENEKRAWSR